MVASIALGESLLHSAEGNMWQKGETMKSLRVAGIAALLVLCVGMAAGQDALTMLTTQQPRLDM
jgi:hypothetical protein